MKISIVIFLIVISFFLVWDTVYLSAGELDDRKAEIQRQITEDPNNPELHLELGQILVAQYLFDEAMKQYTEALRIKPNYAEAAFARGTAFRMFYYQVKKEESFNDQAINDFSLAIKANPKFETAYSNLGAVYRERKEYDKAIKCCEEALNIRMCSKNYYDLAIVYMQMGEKEKACKLFNTVISLDGKGFLGKFASEKLAELNPSEQIDSTSGSERKTYTDEAKSNLQDKEVSRSTIPATEHNKTNERKKMLSRRSR